MTTESELEYLYGLSRFGIKPGLAVMRRIMKALGHPEQRFKSIHVTGTNGKGSTCAMIESVLRQAGYRTALYTSPHLYAFNERISVNGQQIPDELLGKYVSEIRTACEGEGIQPTFFEFTTALAFLYFSRSGIDIAVVEVGMGGRYDATNVIIPLVSVITNVGLDHMEFLGSTKEKIAKEKAGIIKRGVPVVTAEEDESILDIFDDEAREKNTSVISACDEVKTNIVSSGLDEQEVEVRAGIGSFTVHLPLLGSHQVNNMAMAIAALLQLGDGMAISQDAIISGIGNVTWEGRLQVVSRDPLVIIDGAHNADGMHALSAFLHDGHFRDRGGVLVFAAKKGKDVSDMLELIVPFFHTVIVTEGVYMPENADDLAQRIVQDGVRVIAEPDVGRAMEIARSRMNPGEVMLVAGSLYMIPEALKCF